MSQTINRMYGSTANAEAAAAELKSRGYDEIYVVRPPEEADRADLDAITAAIMKSNVLKAQAKIFAVGVSQGGSLVTVHALFGTALRAIRILDSHAPIESGYEEPREPAFVWDEATPVSCMFGLPVLTNDPTPLSKFAGVPVLARDTASMSGLLGLPLLTRGSASLSSLLGLPLLARSSTGLSQMLGLPLLITTRPARRA